MFKTLIAFTLILIYSTPLIGINGRETGLTISVTFPNLEYDVKKLACPGDRVFSIVPADVDPHHYELTPRDVEVLLNSDIIVTTGHTHFEMEIKEMVERRGVDLVLIEIPSLESMKYRYIPGTSRVNLHGLIYDPSNYLNFMSRLYETLVSLNPGKKSCYENNYVKVVDEISSIINASTGFKVKAVADSPLVQYAVEWVGIEIVQFVVKEHELPPEPGSLALIEELMINNRVDLAVVLTPTVDKSSVWLENRAREMGVPIIYVPSPMSNGSYTDKLRFILNQLNGLQLDVEHTSRDEAASAGTVRAGVESKLKFLTVAIAVAIPITAFILKKRLVNL